MEVQDTHSRVSFASISGKSVEATFDGGTLTSDSGALLLRAVESQVGVVDQLTQALTDRRHPRYVVHPLADLLKQRVFQIACGYEDANDCNDLRTDPGFKAACDRWPISGKDLASQPTMRISSKTTRLFCTPTAPRATPLRPISFVFFFIVRRISYCTVWVTRDCRALPG